MTVVSLRFLTKQAIVSKMQGEALYLIQDSRFKIPDSLFCTIYTIN